MKNIAVLVSGGGTNLQALIDSSKRGEIKNGKILAIYPDGSYQNITDIIMPRIHAIGKDNPVVAEGLLTDEVKETLETSEGIKGIKK